jgi:hypothetical protein
MRRHDLVTSGDGLMNRFGMVPPNGLGTARLQPVMAHGRLLTEWPEALALFDGFDGDDVSGVGGRIADHARRPARGQVASFQDFGLKTGGAESRAAHVLAPLGGDL